MATRSKVIGDLGEVKVREYLEKRFERVFVFENASGNGLDVVALKKYKIPNGDWQRYLISLEVKTTLTTGSGPSLKGDQKNGYLNAGEILFEAATGTGRFTHIGYNLQRNAQYIFKAVGSGVPMYPLHVRLQLSYSGRVSALHVVRLRLHSFAAPTTKAIFDTTF